MQQFQQHELSQKTYLNGSVFWQKGLDASWMNRFASPWSHSHLQLNQASLDHSIRAIPQRVLVMQGSRNIQVSPKKDFSRLIKLMKESSIKHSGVLFNGIDQVPEVNSAGADDGYCKDMSVFESKVPSAITGWIKTPKATGGGKP